MDLRAMFWLTIFDVEVLIQIWFAEQMDNPIGNGHIWNTSRGNSLVSVNEELIPRGLVFNDSKEKLLLTESGNELAVWVISEKAKTTRTEISEIDQKIKSLEREKGELQEGCYQRWGIILEIHDFRQQKDRIIKELGNSN